MSTGNRSRIYRISSHTLSIHTNRVLIDYGKNVWEKEGHSNSHAAINRNILWRVDKARVENHAITPIWD